MKLIKKLVARDTPLEMRRRPIINLELSKEDRDDSSLSYKTESYQCS